MEKSILVIYCVHGDSLRVEHEREFGTIRSCREWLRLNSKLVDCYRLEIRINGELLYDGSFLTFRSISRALSMVSSAVRIAKLAYLPF